MAVKLLSHRSALCNMVRRIAVDAGEVIMPYFDGLEEMDATTKLDGSPVTKADMEAETLIEKALIEILPEVPVVGEEAVAVGKFGKFSMPEYFWLVDPLDGTKEFVEGGENFTVNIALIHQQNPVLGVVYAPALGEMYAGYINEDGSGSAIRFLDDTQKEKNIHVRIPPARGLTVMASTHHRSGGRMDQFLEGYKVEKVIRRASSLKICAVACGKADMYVRLGPTGQWDTAAGDAILRAAGGVIKDFETRQPLQYGAIGADCDFRNPEFLASVGELFE